MIGRIADLLLPLGQGQIAIGQLTSAHTPLFAMQIMAHNYTLFVRGIKRLPLIAEA